MSSLASNDLIFSEYSNTFFNNVTLYNSLNFLELFCRSNFFIADKDAKSSDLYKLVNFVKDSIFDKYDVMLQEEIIFVGDFS